MHPQSGFTAEVYQNEYLPDGGRMVDAVITITGSGGGDAARPARSGASAAQVIMVDCSGSMSVPGRKISAARRATAAAIDALRDGVPFAVIAGTSQAEMVYPTEERMQPATVSTRAGAKLAVRRLEAEGGTAMSTWLVLANRLFAGQDAEVNHAILLTDGQNGEPAGRLERVLAECEGRFICDSRGIGTDWVATELRKVASTLLGTADGLETPEQLPAVFRALTEAAMGKSHANVWLRLWTPAGAAVRFLKQVYPRVEDLTGRRTQVSERVGDYPTGAWGPESRDYHLSVEVPPGEVEEEMLAARVSLVAADRVLAERLVLARWTEDTALSTRINAHVAHYTGQAELATAIQEGLAARDAGDEDVATAKLGRAAQLAAESGHDETAKLLARVVDVVDAASGTVRLKRRLDYVDAEIANVRSTKTVRTRGGAAGPAQAGQ